MGSSESKSRSYSHNTTNNRNYTDYEYNRNTNYHRNYSNFDYSESQQRKQKEDEVKSASIRTHERFTTLDAPSRYQYVFFPNNFGKCEFSVRASSDVHIALCSINRVSNPMYEVTIGEKNTYSTILKNQTKPNVATVYSPLILSKDEFRGFWICWRNTTITVGRKGSREPLINWTDNQHIPIRYIGFCTTGDSDGSWIIEHNNGNSSDKKCETGVDAKYTNYKNNSGKVENTTSELGGQETKINAEIVNNTKDGQKTNYDKTTYVLHEPKVFVINNPKDCDKCKNNEENNSNNIREKNFSVCKETINTERNNIKEDTNKVFSFDKEVKKTEQNTNNVFSSGKEEGTERCKKQHENEEVSKKDFLCDREVPNKVFSSNKEVSIERCGEKIRKEAFSFNKRVDTERCDTEEDSQERGRYKNRRPQTGFRQNNNESDSQRFGRSKTPSRGRGNYRRGQYQYTRQYQHSGSEAKYSKNDIKLPSYLLDFNKLEEISKEPAEMIVVQLQNANFEILFDIPLHEDFLILIVKILSKLCMAKFVRDKTVITNWFLKKEFLNQIIDYISKLPNQTRSEKVDNLCFWEEPQLFWKNLFVVCRAALDIQPSLSSDYHMILITNVCEETLITLRERELMWATGDVISDFCGLKKAMGLGLPRPQLYNA